MIFKSLFRPLFHLRLSTIIRPGEVCCERQWSSQCDQIGFWLARRKESWGSRNNKLALVWTNI